METAERIEAARAGEPGAFSAIVRQYQKAVYGLAMRQLRSHTDADEIAQQTFVRAFRALDTFEGRGSFKGWLLKICLNLCRNHLRSSRNTLTLVEDRVDPGAGPAESLEAADERAVLRAAVAKLPVKQREVVELRIYQELTFAEVATVMHSNANTAKVNFHHAVKALRELLKHVDHGENGDRRIQTG